MDELLPEAELQELSKTLRVLIPKKETCLDDGAFQKLESKFRGAVHTASSANLSVAHGTAAWNCLHAFLDQGISSSVPEIRAICFASETWIEIFGLFLATWQNSKSKPMKQVMFTLAKVLSQHIDENTRNTLKNHVITTTVSIICQPSSSFSIKPVFQVLEHFIQKGVIDASDLVLQYSERLSRVGESILVETTELTLRDKPIQFPSAPQVETFISNVLDWVRYPDIASITGGFLVAFCRSLQKHPCVKARTHCSTHISPLWAAPIKNALQREPNLLEIFGLYILPGLLKLNPSETKDFLDTLPLEELMLGKARDLPTIDIEISLLTIRECLGLRLFAACGSPSPHSRQDHYSIQIFALNLIVHPSPTIRITALSLAIYPPISSKPLSIHVIEALQENLPHFHTETNPKIRNEYLVIIKALFIRARRGVTFLLEGNISADIFTNTKIVVNSEVESITEASECEHQLLEKHISFLNWFDDFLINELQPAASYQRHITALKAILSIGLASRFKNGSLELLRCSNTDSEAHIIACDYFLGFRLIRFLLDLIMDSFNDVRSMAALILYNIMSNLDSSNNLFKFDLMKDQDAPNTPIQRSQPHKYDFSCAIDRAKTFMSSTGRADHADGFGRLYRLSFDFDGLLITSDRLSILDILLSSLSENIRYSRDNLSLAIGHSPLHGNLIALREIISSQHFHTLENSSRSLARQLNTKILDCCGDVWDVVKQVLCVDSPEGFEIDESEENDSGTGSKDSLSFAWRALKESSLLASTLLTSTTCHSSSSVLGEQHGDVERIGDLAFTQLAELRHRGAFSTVSQTFAACCVSAKQTCRASPRESNNQHVHPTPADLLQKWYQNALLIIEQKASALTRRSAGLPAIITGILSAHPEGQFFDNAILDLQGIAVSTREIDRDPNNLRLPQVHALNCLKDVFTNTLLGTATEPLMAKTLEIAVNCLQVDIWAIRNCGLMLFRALLSRMHGGTNTASTRISSNYRRFSKLVYEKYPNLPSSVLGLLNSASLDHIDYLNEDSRPQLFAHSSQAQKILPALEIIERAGLPSIHNIEIQQAIRRHMESPIWAIREKSAKALAAVTEDEVLVAKIKTLLEVDQNRQNALHGSLLCARFMISRLEGVSIDGLGSLLPRLVELFDSLIKLNKCPLTTAAYLNIVTDVSDLLIGQNKLMAENFIMAFEDRLWTKGDDHSINSFTDTASMKAAGALLESAFKRFLCLFSQLTNPPSPKGEINEEPSLIVGTKTKPQIRDDLIRYPASTQMARAEVKSFVTVERPDTTFYEWRAEKELGPDLLLNPLTRDIHILSKTETCYASSDPQRSEDDLRKMGSVVGLFWSKELNMWNDDNALAEWICRLSLAADEESELSTRCATVDSIEGFFCVLRSHGFQTWNESTLLGVYVVLYDLLLDDDEDVRDRAAAVTSDFLSTSLKTPSNLSIPLAPPVASLRLLQYLRTELNRSPFLYIEAAYRLTGARSLFKLGPLALRPKATDHGKNTIIDKPSDMESMLSLYLRPIHETMLEVRRQDNSLFAEEKQNLFIDPTKEAENWALVMMHSSSPGWIIAVIGTWALQGLEVLIETAKNEEDGPLGWTSKPDVFTLGMRIILAAKVQIHWLESGLNRNTHFENTLGLLRTLLSVGRKSLLNGIWLQRIEEMLEEAT